MKKFSFRLESVLKLRSIYEEKIKVELGELNKKKNRILQEINDARDAVGFLFKQQEAYLADVQNSSLALSISAGVSGNRQKINILKEELEDLETLIHRKIEQLAAARAEVKVMEKLKEKEMAKYKLLVKRDEIIKNEEQVRLWLDRKGATHE